MLDRGSREEVNDTGTVPILMSTLGPKGQGKASQCTRPLSGREAVQTTEMNVYPTPKHHHSQKGKAAHNPCDGGQIRKVVERESGISDRIAWRDCSGSVDQRACGMLNWVLGPGQGALRRTENLSC